MNYPQRCRCCRRLPPHQDLICCALAPICVFLSLQLNPANGSRRSIKMWTKNKWNRNQCWSFAFQWCLRWQRPNNDWRWQRRRRRRRVLRGRPEKNYTKIDWIFARCYRVCRMASERYVSLPVPVLCALASGSNETLTGIGSRSA